MADLPRSQSGRSLREVAFGVAREAGAFLVECFQRPRAELGIRFKGRGNLVTEVDLQAEKLILGRLAAEFPHWQAVAEESAPTAADSPDVWIVDPLDGTNNFSFGIPFFSVTLAAMRQGEVEFGLVYDPLRQEMFWAERGGGAHLDGKTLAVSAKGELQTSLVGLDMGYYDARGAEMLDFLRRLWPGVFSFRILGSGALGLVYAAAGRLDVYMHRCLYPWDIAGGTLLVREAGGTVTDWHGQPLTFDTQQVVATNPALHAHLLARMAHIPTP